MEVLAVILGGAVGAALVTGVFSIIRWKLDRKAKKEDAQEQKQVTDCSARKQEIAELKRLVEVLMVADRTILYDRIKHLAKTYIRRGSVTIDEWEDLSMMHKVYHDKDKLNGNGFLDELMETVKKLLE